jgi:hypothetical protein
MSSEPLVFADAELARKTARELYPDAQHITLVDHAYDNIVALIDETYALRFPRNDRAASYTSH